MPGYGILDFYATATSYGIARNNTFRIKEITGDVYNGDPNDIPNLMIFARDGLLPSRKVNSESVFYKNFQFNVPMDISYPESQGWSVTFLCDKDYILRDIFEQWSVKQYEEHSMSSESFNSDNPAENSNNLVIAVLANDTDGGLKETRLYTLVGCYPQLVGPISYNNSSGGELATMQVTLNYQYIISDNQV